MEELTTIISEIPQLEREFHYYCRIFDISSYILKNKRLIKNNISLIIEMHNAFFNLILSKTKMTEQKYSLKYEEFSIKLFDWMEHFHLKIYTPSEHYNQEMLNNTIHNFFNCTD